MTPSTPMEDPAQALLSEHDISYNHTAKERQKEDKKEQQNEQAST